MANRGTKKGSSKGKLNWTGKDFKKWVINQLKKVSDDEWISVNRGTKRVKAKDIKKKKGNKQKPKYVNTGRGTSRKKL